MDPCVAYLFPHDDHYKRASQAIEASPRYMPPRLTQPSRTRRSRRDRHERESTEPPQDSESSTLDFLPCLAIGFSDIPRTDKGIVFGSNPNCDVILDSQGVSNVHFSLTFDQYYRPIIRDLGSLVGTEVTYDRDGQGIRRQFQWIIYGHDIPQRKESIVVTIPRIMSFRVIVPFHNIESPEYILAVDIFKQGKEMTDELFGDLGVDYPETRAVTGAHTPGAGEIYLRERLGEGGYGTVTHLWNVSSGREHVEKAPPAKAIRRRNYSEKAWRREARLMSQVSHLRLEYVPLGSLEEMEDISYDETSSIVHQCLWALVYLHGLEPPIAHRDIKPENILVEHRLDDIYVKLGDFGLSRDTVELMTFCGTTLYLAPEVYAQMGQSSSRGSYTSAVDIWSLGVVACKLLCGFPQYKDHYRDDGVEWCTRIVTRLRNTCERTPSDLRRFLSHTMVILAPDLRFSASECDDMMTEMIGNDKNGHQTPTQGSYLEEDAMTTPEYTMPTDGTESPPTVICQPRSQTNVATSPYPFVRSEAPPPESFSSEYGTVPDMSAETVVSTPRAAMHHIDGQREHELTYFMEEYATNPCNSLYVGSSLAAQLGDNDGWASEFLDDSVAQNQAWGLQTNTSSRRTEARLELYLPGQGLEPENFIAGGLADEFAEMAEGARLLQVIAQNSNAV
ncbi:hypothetical protein CABS02_13892 [Colletotrichum abscissum]|uniref:Uncharacterized protein n=1 Tax=Colletotrichum abscissum TaxID=1671311 RepID=A0A9Q0AWL6_9PEZI|nr:hypothetical protein CABS02_13892 [Colletotrichum abscissum]